MSTNTNKLKISGFAEMARSVQTYVSGQLQNIDFSGLQDTPTGYLGHSGDYLVVNNNESGIHFTGIEKIAADLTDYGFSAGETTFTGLSDTPSDFTAGKYLRVNDAGDALEYVDITGASSGGGGGQIHARFSGSTGAILTKSSNWDTYVDSITFPEGSWNGYLQINYKNDFTTVPTTLATADHRESVPNPHVLAQVQAQTVSSCVIIIGDTTNSQVQAAFNVAIFSDEIAGGSSGGGRGGIGSNAGVIAKSNFSELLPDRINVPITRGSNTFNEQERYFHFEGFFTNSSNDETIQYEWNIGGGQRFHINFKNNANGDFDGYFEANDTSNTDVDFSKIPSAITNQPTLKEFIAANRAIYLGGGESSSSNSATSYIDSVVTKTEDGPIDKRSTDTTASGTNYYRVPIESLRFDDLEVGATYRINVTLLGHHGSNDLGVNLNIYNRASSFSSDINLDSAGLNNYNNNGGDTDSAIITIASVGNDTTLYGETHSQTKIFEATGTHLDVLASSISSNSFFRNIIIQLEKLTVGNSGGNYEFCRSAFSSSLTIGHARSSLDLDPNQLTTNSQDWTHTDTTLNVVGIKIPEDGLYNLNFHIAVDTAGNTSHWINNIALFDGILYCLKSDGTTNIIINKQESKNIGNGTNISVDLSQDNEYLEAGDFLYIDSRLYDNTGGSITFPVEGKSFFSISKAGTGGSVSSGGGDTGSSIVFDSTIESMTVPSIDTNTKVPYLPDVDTYSAWDSTNNYWVAPKDMTVLVTTYHLMHNNHLHFTAYIRVDGVIKSASNATKDSTNTDNTALNCSAVVELTAGAKLYTDIQINGVTASTTTNKQSMTITELAGSSSGGGGSITPQFCNVEGLNTTQSVSHEVSTTINFDGDLSTGSQNWRTYNTDLGANVIAPGEAGYYNINAQYQLQHLTGVEAIEVIRILVFKYNTSTSTSTEIVRGVAGFGTSVGAISDSCNATYDNVYLESNEVIYVKAWIYKTTNTSTSHNFSNTPAMTFLQVERSFINSSTDGNPTDFVSLTDAPVDYIDHSGDYLVVNDGESGIHFTGIEKIAQDLTDYGFSAGETTFTGLSDTPSDFTAGKYLRVNDAGDALEYVDITGASSGGSGGGYIHAVFNGDANILSKSSNWDTYVNNITIPQGGTFVGYARINYKNAFSSLPNVQVTADHLDSDTPPHVFGQVQAQSVSSCDIVISNTNASTTKAGFSVTIFSDEIAGAGGGDTPQFCKASFTSTSYLRHDQYNKLSIDTNNFHTGSQDWSYNSTSDGVVGLRPPGDGYYDIFGSVGDDRSKLTEWVKTTQQRLRLSKKNISDGTTTVITTKGNAKYNTLNGSLTLDLNETNVYLTTDEYIYVDSWIHNSTYTTTNFPLSTYSHLSLTKSSAGGGGFSSGETTFTGLSDTPSDFTAGKYLRVNDAGDALEYVDITGVSSGGGSTVLPSGSILQKVVKSFPGIQNTTLGQEIGSIDFTPKASDSLINCEISFSWGDQGNNSLQQGAFFVDGVQVPGDVWYNNIQTTNNNARITTFDQVTIPAENTNTRTISNKITLQQNGSASIGEPYISIEEIAQSDYLAGGGSGGSNQCGINSLELTNDHPSTDSIEIAIPDAIIATNTSSNDFILSLEVLTNNSTDLASNRNLVYTAYGTQYNIDFTNDANGSFKSSIGIIAAHQQNLKWFIDNGRALYYGSCGGSGSEVGGGSNTQDLTEQISQTIVNDDLIIVDTDYSFQTKYLNGSISSNGRITDLEFNNLTVGDTYRMSSTVSINSNGTASDRIKVNYYHDGNKIAAVYSDNISQSVSTSLLFNATSNSLLVSGENLDTNNYIEGSPNEITFTQIEKISNNLIAPEIIAITDGSTQTFDGATMADNNYIKIEGDNVSATIEIDGDSFVVSQSGEQMIWDQGGIGETTLNLGESINITLSNGRVIEIKFYRSGSLYFAINKKSEPTIPQCVSSPVTITVESEYDSETSTSTFNYITSDSSGNGGLFGCIDVNRGETLTIFVTGDEPNLLSHPLKITNYNDLGQAMAPLSGVVKTDLTEGPYEDHTYSLTWVVPCDTTIDKYQYQCENHAGMRGTINVLGTCPSPTPTPSITPTPTPSITPTPSVSAVPTGEYFDRFNSNEEMFLPIILE